MVGQCAMERCIIHAVYVDSLKHLIQFIFYDMKLKCCFPSLICLNEFYLIWQFVLQNSENGKMELQIEIIKKRKKQFTLGKKTCVPVRNYPMVWPACHVSSLKIPKTGIDMKHF